jgi:cytochrome c oxidase cbb3-type subunit III
MRQIAKIYTVLLALAFIPASGWAQAAAQPAVQLVKKSPYQDPVFYLLAVVAVILLAFIFQLQKVLIAVAQKGERKDSGGSKIVPSVLFILALAAFPESSFAQAAADTKDQVPFLHHGFGSNAFNALVFLITVELGVILYYTRLIAMFTRTPEAEKPYVQAIPEEKPSFWERFNRSVAVEEEAAILTNHNYDGIQELDNSLPPWWKYGFYLTILWGVAYLIHYHVSHTGPSSLEEYNNQLAVAETEMMEYRKKAANLVDETNVKYLADAGDLAKGKEIFDKNCVACHGPLGQGAQVGPNLVDDYWKHGGSIGDIFKTIKNGVQGKGMKAWKSDLTPSMMAQVSSYIKSLHGTNPPNAKAAEGDFYQEAGAAPADSTAVKPQMPADSLNKPPRMAELH